MKMFTWIKRRRKCDFLMANIDRFEAEFSLSIKWELNGPGR